jgi:photosystem II stability/assembly factor-like uncharacterized protein
VPPASTPSAGTHLLITTGDRLVTIDEGRGWKPSESLEGSGARCLAVDPNHADHVLVGSAGGVWTSIDGGRTWEKPELPERDVFSVAISAADGTAYAGTEPSRLFRSRDDGASWEELEALQSIPSRPSWSFPPRPWTSHVRWIAPDPRRAERLLVGIELGGLMYTEDAGATFTDHRPGAQPDVHSLAWHPAVEDRAYEAGGGGAAWSADGGLTWRPADEGRELPYCWAVATDPDDPERWFVSAAPGPFQAHGRGPAAAHLYRWEAEGPWRQLDGDLPDPLPSLPYALVAAGDAVFAGLGDGRILRGADRGEHWEELPVRVGSVTAMVAAIS